MKRFLPFIFTLTLFYYPAVTWAQDEPSAAPQISAFNLGPDNVGALANSVNLFSGELNLPMNLVSIPGGVGLGIDVSIFYNSANIENIVDVWNLDAPTSPMGLGWSMPLPSIVVDNKQTGARDDDDFYLVEGGVSTKLVCVGGTTTKSYKGKTNLNWIITYTPASERWEITKEDGMKYVYGDQNSNRSTVQWIVKWGNWIGDSGNTTNQQRQGLVWNLSEVKNLWGDKILYSYTNVDKQVGLGSLVYHTEASYLYKITDQWGREVELVYGNKLADEIMEPHTEAGPDAVDAYQERYERKYLDKIHVRGGGMDFYEVRLGYATNLFGTGNLTKRVLTSITKVAPNGEKLPAMTFGYLTTGAMRGALNQVTTQFGGTVTYEYHTTGIDLNFSQRDKNITAPSGYSEPRVFIENDYSVVTWRQLDGSSHDTSGERDVKIFAYSWDGQWREKSLGSVGTVKLSESPYYEQDFQVATSRNHFAVLKPISGQTTYWLYIWRKSDRLPGEWVYQAYNINLGTHDVDQERLLIGENFVAVSNNEGKIFRYVWNGNSWNSDVLSETTMRYYTGATNNYIISQNASNVKIHYLDEEKRWQTKNLGSGFNTGAETFWYLSNSFAFAIANASNEYAFHWDQNYLSAQKKDLGVGYAHNSYAFVSNSMINIVDPVIGRFRSFRYNGSNVGNYWIDGGEKIPYTYATVGFGVDAMTWLYNGAANPRQAYYKTFNPNTSLWSGDVGISYYDNIVEGDPAEVGNGVFLVNSKVFSRKQNGSWVNDYNVTSPPTGYVSHLFGLGPNFLAYGEKSYSGGPVSNSYFQFIRNGQKYGSPLVEATKHFVARNTASAVSNNIKLIGGNTVFLVAPGYFVNHISTGNFYIRRASNYQITGKQKDYPITKVTISDGGTPVQTAYDYNVAKGTIDPSGTSPMYNMVTTIPGGGTVATNSNGRTETYFFNTLTAAELDDTFPQESPGNISTHFKVVTGQPYRTKVYSNTGGPPIAESETYWTVNTLQVVNSASTVVEWGLVPRVYKTISKQDGREVHTEIGYSIGKNQMISQRVQTKHSTGFSEIVDYNYTYAWEKYTSCVTKNILTPVVQTTKKINGTTFTESNITRWKDWAATSGTVPSPYDNYAWNGTGSPTFTNWDPGSTPSSPWIFGGRVKVRETAYGRPVEQESRGGQVSSTLWSPQRAGPLAEITNAESNQVFYAGYEEATTGYSTDAKVGAKSQTVSQAITLPSPGTYRLTYWKKTGSTWDFVDQTISSNTTIGGGGALIDEVKLHPLKAAMTTYSYDVMGNVISVSDPSNTVAHKEYDVFGRPTLSRDQDRNIVKHNFYRFKN